MPRASTIRPDIQKTLSNLRDELSKLLLKERGAEWTVQEDETPARFVHRFLLDIEAGCATPGGTLAPTETVSSVLEDWRPSPGNKAETLAYALKQLYMNYRIQKLSRLLDAEHHAWSETISALESALKTTRRGLEDASYVSRLPGRLLLSADMAGVLDRLKQEFPKPPPKNHVSETETEALKRISKDCEVDLSQAFGIAAIAKLVIDGQTRDGRKPEDRVRTRLKANAEIEKSGTPQTAKGWVLILDS